MMHKKLNIGIPGLEGGNPRLEKILSLFQIEGSNFEVSFIHSDQEFTETGNSNSLSDNFGMYQSYLIDGNCDILAIPLDKVPTELSESIVITALSEREHTGYTLIIKENIYDAYSDLKVKPHSYIGVRSSDIKVQILEMNQDLMIVVDPTFTIADLTNGDLQGIVISTEEWLKIEKNHSNLKSIPIHPKEMPPLPGNGVWAFICNKEDIPLRKLLKNIHNPNSAKATNVERTLLKHFQTDKNLRLSAYCDYDKNGYFHVFATLYNVSKTTFKKTNISQSTSFNIIERIIQNLES